MFCSVIKEIIQSSCVSLFPPSPTTMETIETRENSIILKAFSRKELALIPSHLNDVILEAVVVSWKKHWMTSQETEV